VDRGLLQPEDVARHPMSHVLVRAVGVNPEIDLDVVQGDIESGDVYFLCSDGIYDVLEEDEIAALLAKSGKIDAMEKMISMALDLGARDNVTGIIVRPQLAG
jgi:serine/threonine protein phosphatase Stp1